MTPLDPAGVLVEVDVHLPVQAVLDPPMPAQHLAVHPGARLATADEVAHLHTRLVFDRALADTHPDHLQILPLRLRTKTLRLRQDGITTPLDAAMSFVFAPKLFQPRVVRLEGLVQALLD